MKSLRSFSTLLITALLATTAPVGLHAADGAAHGHDHSDGGIPEWAELFGDASLAVVWQSTTASADKITTALAEKKLESVAAWAETIHLASHALMDQVKLPDPERKKRLDAALEQAAKLADEVLDAAQHDESEQAAAAFRRLQSALTLAKSRLPKDITTAAPEAPRFAAPPKQDEGEHGHTH